MIDLTGERFGKLVAVAPDGTDKYKRYYWKCKCDCGNQKRVKSNNLRTGNTKSCGCDKKVIGKNIRDLTGHVFGELTVIERDLSKVDKGKVYWLCACSYGEIVSVWMAHLLNKHNVKCAVKGRHATSDSHRRTVWAEEVKTAYNNTCQKCGSQENLHAHHIVSFTKHKELRFEVSNGICLCESCHKNFHRLHGVMKNTKAEFNAWLQAADYIEKDAR